jgi:hypothetical protein
MNNLFKKVFLLILTVMVEAKAAIKYEIFRD